MADSGPYVLAVDLGTSGPKAALVSLQGRIMSTGRARVETIFLPDDGAEQDPESVWGAVKEACGSALRGSDVSPKDVLAVICSSQYSSVIPVDADGHPTMNMVVWLDQRGSKKRLQKLANYPGRTDTPLKLLQWIRIHGHAGRYRGGLSTAAHAVDQVLRGPTSTNARPPSWNRWIT